MNGTELENLRAQLAASADEQNRLNAVAHDQFMQLASKDAELAAAKQVANERNGLRTELAQCRQAIDVLRRIKAWDIENYSLDIPLDIRREMQKVIELSDAATPPQEKPE